MEIISSILAFLVGMITKYSEIVLAVKYRERGAKDDWVGGPMYYISKGLGRNWKWLAGLFAVFAILASFGIGNMSQVNSITSSVINAVSNFTAVSAKTEQTLKWVMGIVLAVLVAVILIGGIKRIGAAIEFGVKPGSELITAALTAVFGGKFASLFIAVAPMLFAFSILPSWSLYGTRCVQYLFEHKAIRVFQVIFILVVVVGCVSPSASSGIWRIPLTSL